MSDSDKPHPAERVLKRAGKLLERARAIGGVGTRVGLDPRTVREHLLIETQTAAFRELHHRFSERAGRGEDGIPNALDALDAMWLNVRRLRAGAPAIIKTLSSRHGDVQLHLAEFYAESTALLEDAITRVFAAELPRLALPPARMAVIIRVVLEGLIIELAQARTPDDVVVADQAYADVRVLFERFALDADGQQIAPIELEPIPLPW